MSYELLILKCILMDDDYKKEFVDVEKMTDGE